MCYCCSSPFVFPFSDIHLPKCHPQPERVIPSRVTRHDFPLVGWRGLVCGECGGCSDRAHNSVYGEQFCSNTSCLFLKYKWRPLLNEARVILCPILRTWKWQYITIPYRNPLNTEKRKRGRGISYSLNRVGIVLNKFDEIAVSWLMFNVSGSAWFESLFGYRLTWPRKWEPWEWSWPFSPIYCRSSPVEIKSRIQDNKSKNVPNNNKTSGAVWLRSIVFNCKWWENFAYLGKEGAEKNIWSNMCSRILEEQNKWRSEEIIWRIEHSNRK